MKWFVFLLSCLPYILCHNIGQRIIGGTKANAGQFPFLAAIYVTKSDESIFCGGTLLNNDWVLTAGQCVDGATLFTIYLGTNSLAVNEPTTLKLATDNYVLHPDYNPFTLENDIGLIKFRLPITFTDYIKPVEVLPASDILPNAAGIMTTGWGLTSDEDISPINLLNWAYVSPLSIEECRLTYGNAIFDTMLCAAGRYNEGTCIGDTGSPLIQYRRGTISIHIGIASFISSKGCESTDPSGYTKTFSYVDWIQSVIDGN